MDSALDGVHHAVTGRAFHNSVPCERNMSRVGAVVSGSHAGFSSAAFLLPSLRFLFLFFLSFLNVTSLHTASAGMCSNSAPSLSPPLHCLLRLHKKVDLFPAGSFFLLRKFP